MTTLTDAILATITAWGAQPEEELHLERSIFGSTDPRHIARSIELFCADKLSAPVADCFFWRSSIGSVFGVLLTDGRRVVIKAHPPTVKISRLQAMRRAQQFVAERGFPCPSPILGPVPIGYGYAMVEELVDSGTVADARDPKVLRVMAETLARLVALTRELGPLPELTPTLPVRDLPGALWPIPHNAMFDFEATAAGAEWIDAIARSARQVILHDPSPLVIGHTDWKTEHFRWVDGAMRVIYDWDSLAYTHEASVVGGAAATFTANWETPEAIIPRPEETLAFITEYESARGTRFTDAEQEAILARVTYARAYGARCEHSLAPDATSFPPGSLREGLVLHREWRRR